MRQSRSLLPTLLLAFTLVSARAEGQDGYRRPPELGDEWRTAHAESLGLNAARLAGLTAAVRAWPELGVHAILIERRGRLVLEEYFTAHDQRWGEPLGRRTMTRDSLHDLRSVTKSVVSALVGGAVASGAIRSLDQPVIEWFPEYPDLNTPERRRVTLRHVLAMTAGFEWNEEIPYTDPRNDEIRMTRDPQPLRFALSRAFVTAPGSEFRYNGGLVQVMAAVITRATRRTLQEQVRATLFEPLGVTEFEWLGDLAGMPSAASGLRMRPRDVAKFGSLYLNGGKWNGRQVIPAEWITQSTRRHVRESDSPDTDAAGSFGYGYFWWYLCLPTAVGPIEARTAIGNGQQRVFVLPALEMVVTVLAGRYNDFTSASTLGRRILMEHVVPAVRDGVRTGCPGA